MRRVISVANQKGGVAKTTTVANLGAAIANMGYRVALIDLDSQGALSATFGFNPYETHPSTTTLMIDSNIGLINVLREAKDRLWVAPASAELLSAEYGLLKKKNRTKRLLNVISETKDSFDFVLIDTPPNLGLLTVNALVAASELLIPVKTEYLAMRGVRPLLESVWLIRDKINPDLRLLGVLPTMHQKDSPHSQAVITEMKNVFKHKLYDFQIPLDESAAVAPAARKAVVDYQPESAVAKAYQRLAEEVCDVLR